MKDRLAGRERKPLRGRTVMITQAREQAGKLCRCLEKLGAQVIEFPTIKIVPPDSWGRLEEAIKHLEDYDWLIFTSVNGVKYFFSQLKEWHKDRRVLGKLKVAAIGPATAAELKKEKLKVSYVPQEYRAEAIVDGLRQSEGKLVGLRILIPRAKVAREALPQELREGGAQVDVAVVYQTVVNGSAAGQAGKALEAGEVDVITFTSSSTVKNFVALLKGIDLDKVLQSVQIICIGPVTADTARKLGLKVNAVAKEYTIEGLIEALLELIQGV